MRIGIATEVVEAGHHRVLQSFIDDVFPPEITHTVLDPLEVRYGDASGIGENIGNYKYAFFIENLIGVCRSGTISSFGQYSALQSLSIVRSNLVFGCRWNQYIAVQLQEVRVAHRIGFTIILKRPS